MPALPASRPIALRDGLAVQTVSLVVSAVGDEDLTTATAVRSVGERPDGELFAWDWTIEQDTPEPTAEAMTIRRDVLGSELQDAELRPLAGLYPVRLFVTFPSGEVACELGWFVLEAELG